MKSKLFFQEWDWKPWIVLIVYHAIFWFIALYFLHWWIGSLVIGTIVGTLIAQMFIWFVDWRTEKLK